jgi:hypothetical protein
VHRHICLLAVIDWEGLLTLFWQDGQRFDADVKSLKSTLYIVKLLHPVVCQRIAIAP